MAEQQKPTSEEMGEKSQNNKEFFQELHSLEEMFDSLDADADAENIDLLLKDLVEKAGNQGIYLTDQEDNELLRVQNKIAARTTVSGALTEGLNEVTHKDVAVSDDAWPGNSLGEALAQELKKTRKMRATSKIDDQGEQPEFIEGIESTHATENKEEKFPENFADKLTELNELCVNRTSSVDAMDLYTDTQRMYASMTPEGRGKRTKYKTEDFARRVQACKKDTKNWKPEDFIKLLAKHYTAATSVYEQQQSEEKSNGDVTSTPHDVAEATEPIIAREGVGAVSSALETSSTIISSENVLKEDHPEAATPTNDGVESSAEPIGLNVIPDIEPKELSGYREEMLVSLSRTIDRHGEVLAEADEAVKQYKREQAAEIILQTNPALRRLAQEDNNNFAVLVKEFSDAFSKDSAYADERQEFDVAGHKVYLDDQMYVAALGQVRQREFAAQVYGNRHLWQILKELPGNLSTKEIPDVEAEVQSRQSKRMKKGKKAGHYATTAKVQKMQHELLAAETADAMVVLAKEDVAAHALDTVLDERIRFEDIRAKNSKLDSATINFLRDNKTSLRLGGVVVAAGLGAASGGLLAGAVAGGVRIAHMSVGMAAGGGSKKLLDWVEDKWLKERDAERAQAIIDKARTEISGIIREFGADQKNVEDAHTQEEKAAALQKRQQTRNSLTKAFAAAQHKLSIEDARKLHREIGETLAASTAGIVMGMQAGAFVDQFFPQAPEDPAIPTSAPDSVMPETVSGETTAPHEAIAPEVAPMETGPVASPVEQTSSTVQTAQAMHETTEDSPVSGETTAPHEAIAPEVAPMETVQWFGEGNTVWAQADHVLKQGAFDNLIKVAHASGVDMDEVHTFNDLTPAQQTYIIDWLKDMVVAHPENFGLQAGADVEHGFSKSMHLDFTNALEDQGANIMAHMQKLSLDQLANIQHNLDIAHRAVSAGIHSTSENLGHLLGNNTMEAWVVTGGTEVTQEHFTALAALQQSGMITADQFAHLTSEQINNYLAFTDAHQGLAASQENIVAILNGQGDIAQHVAEHASSAAVSPLENVEEVQVFKPEIEKVVREAMRPKRWWNIPGKALDRVSGDWEHNWQFFKDQNVDDLLKNRITGHAGEYGILEGMHKRALREFIHVALGKGIIQPTDSGTPMKVGEAIRQIAIYNRTH